MYPCYGCTERSMTCHSTCSKYLSIGTKAREERARAVEEKLQFDRLMSPGTRTKRFVQDAKKKNRQKNRR